MNHCKIIVCKLSRLKIVIKLSWCFLRRWICRHFCDAFWVIVDSGIPVFPFILRLFFRRGDCLSVKALVSRYWKPCELERGYRRAFLPDLGRQTSYEGVSMPYRCRFRSMARRTTVIQHSWALKRSRKSYWPDIGWKTTLGAVSLPFSADGEKNNDN